MRPERLAGLRDNLWAIGAILLALSLQVYAW